MERDNGYNREEEIQLGAVIALGFRHIKFVIACSLIGAVLFLGGHYLYSKTDKALENFAIEQRDYEAKLEAVENDVESLSSQIAFQKHYNSESSFMKLNPDSFYTAKTVFSVVCDEKAIVGENGSAVLPASIVISQYEALWDSLNFSEIIKTDVPVDYVKEVIGIKTANKGNESISTGSANGSITKSVTTNKNSNTITVFAYANTAEEAIKTVDALSRCLVDGKDNVAAASYKHKLTVVSDTFAEISHSHDISAKQAELRAKVSELTELYLTSSETLKDLGESVPSLYHFCKFAVIGFLIGFLVSCLYLLISFVSKGSVYCSPYMAESFNLSYFGSLNTKEKLFLHEKLLNERLWNKKEAELFISENVKNRIAKGSKVLVLSTQTISRDNMKTVENCLAKQNMVPTFVQSVPTNSEAIGCVKNCDCIILLEKTWTSKWSDIAQAVLLARKFEKEISGFITVLD